MRLKSAIMRQTHARKIGQLDAHKVGCCIFCIRILTSRNLILSLLAVCLLVIGACSNNTSDSATLAAKSTNPSKLPSDPLMGLTTEAAGEPCNATGPLHDLYEKRMLEGSSYDFPIGPADVLSISVADLPEMTKLSARVSGDGSVELPLIGTVQVAGLTEEQVKDLLSTQVRKYVVHPRVDLFVEHYSSRNVAVMGMVAVPGSYPLTSPGESILSLIGRAGGLKAEGGERAAERVVLFPAAPPSNPEHKISALDASRGNQVLASNAESIAENVVKASDASGQSVPIPVNTAESSATPAYRVKILPIVIDLNMPSMAGCLDIPARPGDVVLIPAAGEVGVYGWVQKPGTFPVTAGMTVLGAITSAGGAMFSSNVELLRTSPNGQRDSIPIDLSRVEAGTDSDVAVHGGDVVEVKSSAVGAVPYGIYFLVEHFGTGMYLAPAF